MKKGALLLGFARVSKADDQDTGAQVKALRQAGCKRIFEEKVSDKHARSAAPNRNWQVKPRTPPASPPHGYCACDVFYAL